MDEIRPARKPPRANTSRLRHPIASGTPHNPSTIAPFTGGFSDPPTQSEMQAFAAWSESLRQALIR